MFWHDFKLLSFLLLFTLNAWLSKVTDTVASAVCPRINWHRCWGGPPHDHSVTACLLPPLSLSHLKILHRPRHQMNLVNINGCVGDIFLCCLFLLSRPFCVRLIMPYQIPWPLEQSRRWIHYMPLLNVNNRSLTSTSECDKRCWSLFVCGRVTWPNLTPVCSLI